MTNKITLTWFLQRYLNEKNWNPRQNKKNITRNIFHSFSIVSNKINKYIYIGGFRCKYHRNNNSIEERNAIYFTFHLNYKPPFVSFTWKLLWLPAACPLYSARGTSNFLDALFRLFCVYLEFSSSCRSMSIRFYWMPTLFLSSHFSFPRENNARINYNNTRDGAENILRVLDNLACANSSRMLTNLDVFVGRNGFYPFNNLCKQPVQNSKRRIYTVLWLELVGMILAGNLLLLLLLLLIILKWRHWQFCQFPCFVISSLEEVFVDKHN